MIYICFCIYSKNMEGISTPALRIEEGSSQSHFNPSIIDHFLKDFRSDLFTALNNYWVSRTLFVLGLISSYIFGPFLVGLVLLIDVLLQNPQPLYPRDVLVGGSKFLFSLLRSPSKKVKKSEWTRLECINHHYYQNDDELFYIEQCNPTATLIIMICSTDQNWILNHLLNY